MSKPKQFTLMDFYFMKLVTQPDISQEYADFVTVLYEAGEEEELRTILETGEW
jgi:hypothetical protein